jgi:peroxiredoxin
MICRRQVVDIQEQMNTFNQLNVRIVVIGNGFPNFIEGFRNDTGYTGDLYTDPSLKSYQLLNFKNSVTSLLGFKTIKSAVHALSTGYLQKGIQGDALQQGGVVVIDSAGEPVYFYANSEAGDHAPLNDIIQACT